jgi:hypothetical protein
MPKLEELQTQNGLHPKDFYGFWKDWHLVTVRYRSDNQEQRFVFANDIAWKAIQNQEASYPDGAMLGKVGYSLSQDESFPSSLVPERVMRIQIMRKSLSDQKSEHDGWSYWLYSKSPDTLQMGDRELSTYCHSCHALVPQNDFVFSTAVFHDSKQVTVANQLKDQKVLSRFADLDTINLNAKERAIVATANLPAGSKLYRMPLFEGSLSELVPFLAENVKNSALIVMDADRHSYLAGMPADKAKSGVDCDRPILFVKSLPQSIGTQKELASQMRYGILCPGKPLTWTSERP